MPKKFLPTMYLRKSTQERYESSSPNSSIVWLLLNPFLLKVDGLQFISSKVEAFTKDQKYPR